MAVRLHNNMVSNHRTDNSLVATQDSNKVHLVDMVNSKAATADNLATMDHLSRVGNKAVNMAATTVRRLHLASKDTSHLVVTAQAIVDLSNLRWIERP